MKTIEMMLHAITQKVEVIEIQSQLYNRSEQGGKRRFNQHSKPSV